MVKKLSNPFSTGGGGWKYENIIQSSYVVLMLTNGCIPTLPCWSVKNIKLQGKYLGYETDDLIVTVYNNTDERKSIIQIKHEIKIQESDKTFQEVINSFWADFNNEKIFKYGLDNFSLITSILNRTDYSLITVLEKAKYSDTYEHFINNLSIKNYYSNDDRKKLEVLINCLKISNKNQEISNDQIFRFLKSFNILIFESEGQESMSLSLIHSHLSLIFYDSAKDVFREISDYVNLVNKNAGVISLDLIPFELKRKFINKKNVDNFGFKIIKDFESDFVSNLDVNDKVILFKLVLIGSWNEDFENDKFILEKLIGTEYSKINIFLRKYLDSNYIQVRVNQSVWSFENRIEICKLLITDSLKSDFDVITDITITVLSEIDTFFIKNKDSDDMYFRKEKYSYSSELRSGIANGISFLGNMQIELKNCNTDYHIKTVEKIVTSLISNAKWDLWISLNDQIQTIIEASPSVFLNYIKNGFINHQRTLELLQTKENNSYFAKDYILNYIFAFEKLAWTHDFFIESMLNLFHLSEIYNKLGIENYPLGSIVRILLPWDTQTLVNFDFKKIFINKIIKINKDLSWQIIEQLLPNQKTISFPTIYPKYLNIEIPDKIENDRMIEYDWYSNILIDILDSSNEFFTKIIHLLEDISPSSFTRFKALLKSDKIINLDETERYHIWSQLLEKINDYSKSTNYGQNFIKVEIQELIEIANILEPKNNIIKAKRLFQSYEYKLFPNNGDYNSQREILFQNKVSSLNEIIDTKGIDGVLELSKIVDSNYNLGRAYSHIIKFQRFTNSLNKFCLGNDDYSNLFVRGLFYELYQERRFSEVNKILDYQKNIEVLKELVINLPFVEDTWEIAKDYLYEEYNFYWKYTYVNSFSVKEDYKQAIEELNKVDRYIESIECIYNWLENGNNFDFNLIERTLIELTKVRSLNILLNEHYLSEIIKILQKNYLSTENMVLIEWNFMSIINSNNDLKPVVLIKHMNSNPEFFVQLLSLAYENKNDSRQKKNKNIIFNVLRTFESWKVVPGTNDDGTFSFEMFKIWFETVKNLVLDLGYYEIALVKIGHVLVYTPKSENLWINEDIALLVENNNNLQDGFKSELFNSRGIHSIDYSGEQEKKLEIKYNSMANQLREFGFTNFARSLYNLGKYYSDRRKELIDESLDLEP